MTRWTEIARTNAGDDYAQKYADRFRAMARRGEDTHGEASFVASLVAPPATVLDAGCGTGRVSEVRPTATAVRLVAPIDSPTGALLTPSTSPAAPCTLLSGWCRHPG